ncbi:peptidoglycan editing factor PgeF [Nocardioides campestrisoli]|uniref:peptidoglycan editing factor PgeF n=1 Tax=Nocardioides campestrisoli TaxID=2736757 RepID=UPI00163D489C|nr:peptidoglycan editing factor PgeF [Nocardioides campestrisoli]
MFAYRDSRKGDVSQLRVDVAFTDATLDLQGLGADFLSTLARVEGEAGVPFARLTQVHGDEVVVATGPMGLDEVPAGDALVSTTRGLGLMIRVADCVPVLLADPEAGVVAGAHAGRRGLELDIVTRTVESMRRLGAREIVGWIGPAICGRCYEVPEQMRDEVAAVVPESRAETSWGTAALDIPAGVRAQLVRAGVEVEEIGRCTREDARLHSYRRDGEAAGRLAGLVWLS